MRTRRIVSAIKGNEQPNYRAAAETVEELFPYFHTEYRGGKFRKASPRPSLDEDSLMCLQGAFSDIYIYRLTHKYNGGPFLTDNRRF